ncbi:TetR/AcrR family transcriptional regulator [Streptomyces sp. 4503]|uniref:TetR/AcrR family transcriptional regulator n=1 Tax=Streptomyces niphimycinicus TaxID=2842201 RepID=A0ABS6CBF1_9ACTN|nr:TetR/AcrR family transcriptional regulator [Streptomyces niphimycinicus]MBU3864208.1 TetR/AcrR family transcriptional regulator [Streptomyces niphimycinicus]
MAGRRAARDAISRDQWAALISARNSDSESGARRAAGREKTPITVERIIDAALQAVEAGGFEDLTMRRVATRLGTGPASLYAHVRNRAELGDLLIGRLCSQVALPAPDPACWREQFMEVCAQLRDQFLRYPGIAQAALTVVPADLATLRVGEGMLAILLASGAPAQQAAWAGDAAFLYITGYCLEAAAARRQGEDVDGRVIDRAEIEERLRMLPPDLFPHTVTHARELTSGTGHDRFTFTLTLLLQGLIPPPSVSGPGHRHPPRPGR